MTDSQVMARIFYYSGYDVLNEYNGGAVFVIVDYRNKSPKTYLFKGASKEYKNSEDIKEERPLYYCIDLDKKELVFSSIGVWLFSLRRECDVYIMEHNTLLEFTGETLTPTACYNREDAYQRKEHTVGYTKYYDLKNDFYLSPNILDNTYSFNGKKAHGKLYVTRYGRVDKMETKYTHEIWFFDGVALKDVHCFRFLTVLKKKSGLNNIEFNKKFGNVIRYLSIDGIYCKNDMWYKAISPTGSILYTGTQKPICAVTGSVYSFGVKKSEYYEFEYSPIEIKPLDINFKEIGKECESLMK